MDEIVAIVDGPISTEVVSLEAEGMVREGKELAAIHENIVVKVPTIPEGVASPSGAGETSAALGRRSTACSMSDTSFLVSNGFGTKSYAPFLTASTAISIVPNALMTTTGVRPS